MVSRGDAIGDVNIVGFDIANRRLDRCDNISGGLHDSTDGCKGFDWSIHNIPNVNVVTRSNDIGSVDVFGIDVAYRGLDGCCDIDSRLNHSVDRRNGFHRGIYDVPKINVIAGKNAIGSVDFVKIDIGNRSVDGCDNFGRGLNGCINWRKNINRGMYGIPDMNVIPGTDAISNVDVVSVDIAYSSLDGCDNISTRVSESINRSGGFDRSINDIPNANVVTGSDFIGSVNVVGINIGYCSLDGCNNIGVGVNYGFDRRQSIDRSMDNVSNMDIVARCDAICSIDILGVNIGDRGLDRSDNFGSSSNGSIDRRKGLNGSGYNVPSFLVANGNGEHGGGEG